MVIMAFLYISSEWLIPAPTERFSELMAKSYDDFGILSVDLLAIFACKETLLVARLIYSTEAGIIEGFELIQLQKCVLPFSIFSDIRKLTLLLLLVSSSSFICGLLFLYQLLKQNNNSYFKISKFSFHIKICFSTKISTVFINV